MKWILVTGGAMRLGASIVKALCAEGHFVVIHYRTHEKQARALAEQCPGSEIIQGDFSTNLEDFIRRYKSRFPDTKGLINNVGNYALGPPSALSDINPLLQTNLSAPIAITHALLPSIKEAKGHIINLGTSGLTHPWTRATAYGITKAALLFYTRSLAKELADGGVCVNMISPGQLDISVDQSPHAKPIPNEEVAKFIAEFLGKRNITGQNIEIAAGYSL